MIKTSKLKHIFSLYDIHIVANNYLRSCCYPTNFVRTKFSFLYRAAQEDLQDYIHLAFFKTSIQGREANNEFVERKENCLE